MRKLYYILFAVCIMISCSVVKPKLYIIQGHVTHSKSWCSGMAPGPDYYQEEQNPASYIGLKLYIKRGKENSTKSKIYTSIITDTAGNFTLKLSAGNYIIIREDKLKKAIIPQDAQYAKWDSACIIENWQNGDYKFSVNEKSNKKISFDLRQYCTWNYPCLEYSGPLPP